MSLGADDSVDLFGLDEFGATDEGMLLFVGAGAGAAASVLAGGLLRKYGKEGSFLKDNSDLVGAAAAAAVAGAGFYFAGKKTTAVVAAVAALSGPIFKMIATKALGLDGVVIDPTHAWAGLGMIDIEPTTAWAGAEMGAGSDMPQLLGNLGAASDNLQLLGGPAMSGAGQAFGATLFSR